MFLSIDQNNVIQAASRTTPLKIAGNRNLNYPELNHHAEKSLVGKKLLDKPIKELKDLRIAGICNWGDQCGIATYTEQLVSELRKHVAEVKIFAEDVPGCSDDVLRCWKRGESCLELARLIHEYEPDVVFMQHEFGIFPKATHFLKLLELLDSVPYVVTLHSVYEHLDKTVCTSYIRNAIVHTTFGEDCLKRLGHRNEVFVLPHGCHFYGDVEPLWNIFQNERAVIQFGFGFEYKGLDQAIEAVKILKERSPDFKDIFYCFLCSESNHTRSIQHRYYETIRRTVEEHGLQDNITVLRGYLSEQHLQNFLRVAKLAVFPYKNNPSNVVYGASGAIRKAMSNGIPVIASDCHLFDDLEGVVPRPSDPQALADEIARVFTSGEHREGLLKRMREFLAENSWESVGLRYAEILQKVANTTDIGAIRLP